MRPATPILAVLFILAVLHSQTPAPYQSTLENGLRILLVPKTGTALVNLVVGIGIGSKDESAETNGWVHLLEHILFSGKWESRNPDTPSGAGCRDRGGLFNAHTDHDLMTVELSLPAEEASFGLRFLRDKVFGAQPDADTLKSEQAVLAEELDQIQDDPARLGMSLVLGILFTGHPYGHPIYGNRKNIAEATPADLKAQHDRYFRPANSVLTVVGDFDPSDLLAQIEEIFGQIASEPKYPDTCPPAPALIRTEEKSINMDIQQAHLFIAFPVPGFNHPDRDKIALLNHLLGSGNHPLLARYMGGKRPLAEGYACRYLSLKRGGALVVHMRSKPEKVGTLKREVVKFLGRLRTFQYSSEDFLEKEQPLVTDFLQAAQNNIRLNSALFRERGLHLARLAARSLLLEDRNIATEDERGILDVTSKDLRTAASKFISGERHAVLMILPNRDQ